MRILAILALAIASLPAPLAAQTPDPLTAPYGEDLCPSCAAWSAPRPPFHVFGNTWFVGTNGLAALLITSPDGHVLIDGGLPNSAPDIIANIRALGFDIADVRLILNSHAHYDHAGGIAALQRASGARVAASVPSAAVLARGRVGPDDPQYLVHLDFPAVSGVDVVADGASIGPGSLRLTAHRTAGHTPGGTTWTWQSCDGAQCLALVYADSQTPVSDDEFRFTDSDRYPSAVSDFERGLAVLETLPCDILLTPHPGASSLWDRMAAGPQAMVDSGACRRYAATARQQLERRIQRETGRS